MDWSQLIQTNVEYEPPKICIYGKGGIGKTTLAAHFPKPIIIRGEDGAGQISGVAKLPKIKSIAELESQLHWIENGKHDYKTLVIDSLDEIQNLKNKEICAAAGVEDVLQLGFGKGTGPLQSYFNRLRDLLDGIREERGMIIICLAHYLVTTHKDPTGDDFSCYSMNLNDKVTPKMKDWSDVTLFINHKINTKKEGESFGKAINKAVSSKNRPPVIIYTEDRPGFIAKNRYNLDPEIPFPINGFQEVVDYLLSSIRNYLKAQDLNAPKPTIKEPEAPEITTEADEESAEEPVALKSGKGKKSRKATSQESSSSASVEEGAGEQQAAGV